MDFKTYDSAFVTKLGAVVRAPGEGHTINVAGLDSPVPLRFDLPEEWWTEYSLPSINVRRIDIVPDPSRFLPNYRTYELSTNPETPNTMNRQKVVPMPVLLLYAVELAADSQHAMNQLLVHNMLALPTAGYGTTIDAFGKSMPFRVNSIRNKGEEGRKNKRDKKGREFIWEYTYAVEAWIFSTECVKVPQILQVDLTFTDENHSDPSFKEEYRVDGNGSTRL